MSLANPPLNEAAPARADVDPTAERRMFRRPSEWRIFWEAFSQDRLAVTAAAVIGLVCLSAILAPLISPYDPTVGDHNLPLPPIRPPRPPPRLDRHGRGILRPPVLGRP